MYSVKAEADRFEAQQNNSVSAQLGQKQTVDFRLTIASANATILVQEQAPLINPDNPNTSTTLSARALEDLPNPGGDMTYPLQFAAGALINTAGSGNDFVGGTNGYGNVQFNGLPSLSNGYIVDGLETNDPLTNLNSGLSTNLVLGLNSIAEVTVNTVSYAVDQGRYGASQVNYVTKSGTNRFHGNLYELWNGSKFNAADFFTNATSGNHKPRSTVNHFGEASGVRSSTTSYFSSSIPNGYGSHFRSSPPRPCRRPHFRIMFSINCRAAAWTPSPDRRISPRPNLCRSTRSSLRCTAIPRARRSRFSAARSIATGPLRAAIRPNGNGCANRQSISHSSDDREQVQTARIDYNIDTKNMAWFRFQSDTGLQAAYTDPINPHLQRHLSAAALLLRVRLHARVFRASGELLQSGVLLVSKLVRAGRLRRRRWRRFRSCCRAAASNAPFTPLGGLDNTWVQGRRAARFFINDNLAWTVGSHEFRFGTNSRIFRLNDYDFGEGVVPLVTYTTLPQFIYGVASTASETFPLANSQPYNFLNLDFYAQDTWKLTRTLTWTFGIRDTYNSNPLNPHDAIARLAGSFDSISHDVNQPLMQVIQTHLGERFRLDARWRSCSPEPRSRGRSRRTRSCAAGFGLFSDILPGSVADLVGVNPPYSKTFQGGLLGSVGGTAIAPGVPNSAIDATVAANQLFNSGFAQGELSCASPLANPNACLPPISITAVPDGKLHAPYFMQWSFALEHQIGNALNLRAQYVGTRAVNQPYETQVNGYQTVCQGCFAPFPYGQPVDPRFGAGNAIEHRREQPLQRPPVDSRQAAGARLSSPGQLHLEPLHGHGLKRRIPSLRRGRAFFRRCRANSAANTAPAITMFGTTSPRNMFISCRSKSGIPCWPGR